MEENKGRARGKARGRARGQQSTADPARRPGDASTTQGAPPAVQQQAPAGYAGPNVAAAGRRTHRGVGRNDPPTQAAPGPQVQQLAESMAACGIESSGRGRSRTFAPSGDDNTRPAGMVDKKGMSGEKINLVANFFEVVSRPNWVVYQYHVDFAPLVESPMLRRAFMREHKEALGECFLFDGMSDLKTVRLVVEGTEFFSQRRTDGVNIRITFKFVAELAPDHPELARLFNTQMKKNLRHLRYQLLGRHYFDQDAIKEIPQYKLQIWQGVTTSIRQQEERLMLSVDTVHKVVRKETALEIITRAASQARGGDYKDTVAKELVGSIVMTRYNNRTYSVEDIDWDLTPIQTFESKSDGPITYVQYYKKQYDIDVRDTRQPLMLCKSKEKELRGGSSMAKKIYLVPELCVMTGITESMRADFTMMREMSTQTRLDPAQRVRNLQIFINRVNANENVVKEMQAWDLAFAKNLVQFQGRIMPPEKIVQGPSMTMYQQKTGDFSKEMRGKPMHVPKVLDDWILICTRRDVPVAQDFLTNLYKVCPPMGMKVNDPEMVTIADDRINNYLQPLRNLRTTTKLVCFVVPNNKKERYDALKKHCCLDIGVPSQVIVARTLSKKQMLMSVATKIGIQLNCKLGGEPWALEIPFKNKVMVVGFDTYHDSAKKGRSAGAFVASLNMAFTRWYSKVTFHSAGGWDEISNHVRTNFTDALKQYNARNNCFPDLIIYYRDGVGDGNIHHVLEWEVKPCKEVIAKNLPDRAESTRFAFIVVNKRINTRFFQPLGDTRYGNPPPGTVVDHTVTRFDRYDFFLVSQSVRQGTVGPTMYNVISDTSGLKPEHLQRLSYKLTHLYFNWPGTIRVPAPCQYAHKLAFLTGQSLHQPPREELCDTLFYL